MRTDTRPTAYASTCGLADGTPEGTSQLLPAELSFVYSYGVFRENLYFSVCRPSRPLDPRNGYRCEFPGDAELWRTDGTPEGTRPVLPGNDLHPWIYGPGFPVAMVPEMARVFFEVFDDTDEDELWVTDGTSQGTRMLKRLADFGLESLAGLEDFGGTLYSLAGKGAGQERRFWVVRSDGTPGGTVAFPAGLGGLPYVVSWEVIGDSWFVSQGLRAGTSIPKPVEVPAALLVGSGSWRRGVSTTRQSRAW